ncbi:MAG: XRE family transcriptional regulator [Rhodoferax sp.]|nr:XRE family transcriptional regulator [Rhodoferax sp.]MDP3654792.1 XRE family transcriptional regulator [Rhodoferax sp.]
MSEVLDTPSSEAILGQRIRALRVGKGWTLEQTGQASGLARSTLSKIENGQMSPTYDALIKLAGGLQIDLSELFATAPKPMGAGRRSICRNNAGLRHDTPYYKHMLLCNDLSNKDMVPFKTTISARAFGDFEDWSRHAGEEFVYVLSGKVKLFTEYYEPEELAPGDSFYIDSRMGHRVISVSAQDAEVLWVSTTHPRIL